MVDEPDFYYPTLLTGAGLLIHSFAEALRVDTGLEPTKVVTARIALTREHRASDDAANKIRERLPSLESLDSLMYKTACLAFAGLAMLLITGAIWANESWGRPWGFDSKETGALVAWLTYAAFLHTRIARGWRGRSSAYFAVIGFLLVIFTYLGVSYLLKGLHSYA